MVKQRDPLTKIQQSVYDYVVEHENPSLEEIRKALKFNHVISVRSALTYLIVKGYIIKNKKGEIKIK